MTDHKVVYLSSAASAPGENALYLRFRRLAEKRLLALFNHALDQTDDALFLCAERAADGREQNVHFVAMREIRLRRRAAETAFSQARMACYRQVLGLGEGADAPLPIIPGAESDGEDAAAEALEERLALEGMVRKAQRRYAGALERLDERLAVVLRGTTDQDGNVNPLHPGHVCGALRTAVDSLNVPIQPRLIIYKLLDRHLVAALGGLYDELNRVLGQAGACPAGSDTAGAAEAPEGDSLDLPEHDPDAAFALLQDLLASGRRPEEAPAVAGDRTASRQQVIAALSRLQAETGRETGADPTAFTPDALRRRIRGELGALDGAALQLGSDEADAIDLVGMLFQVVLEDPNLPGRIRGLLARLQVPIIKVALLDRAFFSQPNHPARALINELARVGVGWSDSATDTLYATLGDIVQRVLDEFGDDIDVFRLCRDAFRHHLDGERERALRIEERARTVTAGRMRVEGARHEVWHALEERVAGRELPACVERILREGWWQVLFVTYFRDGVNSARWRRQLDVVDRLMWTLDPKPDDATRKRLVMEIPTLLHDLREELNGILFNPMEMIQLFKGLEEEHIRILSAPSGAAAADDAQPSREVGPESLPESGGPRAFLEALDAAPTGTWFEFFQDNGKRLRARLSARLEAGDRLTFVNRSGFRVAERRRVELAEALARGSVVMLDDALLFDRALDRVVAQLRARRGRT